MKFKPKTEEEIENEKLWPAGEYDFEILAEGQAFGKECLTCDTASKAGNDMIQLVVRVYDEEGNTQTLLDYLLESIAYKLRHCADATDLLHKYDAGELSALDLIGKTGKCKIGIQKDKDGKYADKNFIRDYVKREDLAGRVPPAQLSKTLNDEIPF